MIQSLIDSLPLIVQTLGQFKCSFGSVHNTIVGLQQNYADLQDRQVIFSNISQKFEESQELQKQDLDMYGRQIFHLHERIRGLEATVLLQQSRIDTLEADTYYTP